MEDTKKVCNNAQQVCLRFQSVASLLKDLQQSNSEEENLLLLGALRDVKAFLSARERQKKAIEDEEKDLGSLVDGLSSHAGVVALKRLVRDVKDIKENLEGLRKRINKIEGRELPRRPCVVDEENETYEGGPLDPTFWERLTKRRQELLGDVEVAFEKRKKSLKFHPSTSGDKTTQHNQATPITTTSPKPALSSVAIDKRLSSRIAKLEDFLVEKQSGVSAACRSVVGTILDTREAACELHNTPSALYRSRIARGATKETIDDREFSFRKDNYGELNFCFGCQEDQRAKDKFWGLASESADEEEYARKILSMRELSNDVTELNEDEAIELFEKLNIEKKPLGSKDAPKKKSRVLSEFPSMVHDSGSSIEYVIKRRPTGRAGWGTWATPPYSPNWVVFKTKRYHQRPRTVSFAKTNKGLNKKKRRNSHTRRKLERIAEAKKIASGTKQIFTRADNSCP